MKLFIALLFLPAFAFGQWYHIDLQKNFRFASVSVDPSTNFDAIVSLGASHGHVRLSAFYQEYSAIKYRSYGFGPSLVLSPLRNIKTVLGGEVSMIERSGPTFMSYGINGQLEYHLKRWFLFCRAELKRRPDVRQKWQYSNYLGIGFKF